MDPDEQALQRAGYIAAFRDPEVLRAIRSGPVGRIAVAYVEWAGAGLQRVILPWTLVGAVATGERIARVLAAAPSEARHRTSISRSEARPSGKECVGTFTSSLSPVP